MDSYANELESQTPEKNASYILERYELFGVVLLLIVNHACYAYFLPRSPDYGVSEFYYYILGSVGWTILLWVLLLRDPTWKPPLPRDIRSCAAEVLVGVMIFAVIYMSSIGLHGFLNTVGITSAHRERREFYAFLKSLGPWGTFSNNLSAFFSSLYEEVLFRVYLLHRLGKYFRSAFWPLVLSSFAFSVVHGYQLPGAITIFYYGLIFGAIYRFSPKLPMIWIAHWLLDLN